MTIAVNGRPQPAINSPVNDLEVLFGTTSTVAIAFSCNDPENAVSWEVFFDTNQVLDGTEVTIGCLVWNSRSTRRCSVVRARRRGWVGSWRVVWRTCSR